MAILDFLTGGDKKRKANDEALALQKEAAARAQQQREEALGTVRSSVANVQYPTYLSLPESQNYNKTLKDRMGGLGLVDVNAQTSPVAAQVRAGLQKTTADIGAAASSRGLGRSTIPVSQIGQASQAAERDIAERMAQLELTRQQQIETAVGQYGNLTQAESTSQQGKANFQRQGDFAIANTQMGVANDFINDQSSLANSIRQNGVDEAANQLLQTQMILSGITAAAGAASGAMTGGATGGGGSMKGGIDGLLEQINNVQSSRNSASVNR